MADFGKIFSIWFCVSDGCPDGMVKLIWFCEVDMMMVLVWISKQKKTNNIFKNKQEKKM